MFGNQPVAVSRAEAVEGDMPLRALLYRRPAEPKAIQVVHDKNIYLVRVRRHRQARRYTLRIQTATREVVLTMPPRGCLKEAREFAQKHGGWIASRLHHLPAAEPFEHGSIVPLRGQPHRIVHRKGERGTVWIETCGRRRAQALRRRRCAACRPADRRFLAQGSPARSRRRQPQPGAEARRVGQDGVDPRSIQPLGLLLVDRRPVLFLAAHSRAILRARLSGCA